MSEDLFLIDLTSTEDKIRAAYAANPSLPLGKALQPLYDELKREAVTNGILNYPQKNNPPFNSRGKNINIIAIGQAIHELFGAEDSEKGLQAMQMAEGRLRAELYAELELDMESEEGDPRDPVTLQCVWDGVGIWMW